MTSVLVFGGYGTFGSIVSRELASRGFEVCVAGRSQARAEALAATLGAGHRGCSCDLRDPASLAAALSSVHVAVNCAGPFSQLGDAVLAASIEAGCHYADISNDRRFAARVADAGSAFAARGRVACTGCSSFPAISVALAQSVRDQLEASPIAARATLFIGDDNKKGRAAVASAVDTIQRPIPAPQGTLFGFRDAVRVPLPEPFGVRCVRNFESPDYDLLPGLFGVSRVFVKVGFEATVANGIFGALAGLPGPLARFLGRGAGWVGRLRKGRGSSGGVVMIELEGTRRTVRRAVVATEDGQRMAALPVVFAVEALAEERSRAGAVPPWELLGPGCLAGLTAAGFTVSDPASDARERWPMG